MTQNSAADDEALGWAVRTTDPAFDDWDSLRAWFEADPSNAPRYHACCDDVATMAAVVPPVTVATRAPPAPILPRAPVRRRWAAGALAASLVASAGYLAINRWPQPFTVETLPGDTRTIALADGSSIALNGGTRLVLDRRNPRIATLDRGEALFTVRHDTSRPFEVTVGERRIVDLGTRFSVARDPGMTRLAVSEGEVAFDPDAANVRLRPGQALSQTDASRRVLVTSVAPSAVGAWQQNMLVYSGTPLREVAADLSRSLDVALVVSPEIADRPFQGTIALTGLASHPASLGPLLGVSMHRSGKRWTLTARP